MNWKYLIGIMGYLAVIFIIRVLTERKRRKDW